MFKEEELTIKNKNKLGKIRTPTPTMENVFP
jgi:hypothetical protein